ncbi:MAG TPA: GAF domain-containing protein [Anaerolineae bacterium]
MACESELFQKQVQALLAIAEAMNASLGRQVALEKALQAIVDTMCYKAALVRLLDVEQDRLALTASYGLSEEYLNKGEVKLPASGLDRRVFGGETVVLDDVRATADLQYPEAALKEGIRSLVALPLRLSGRVVGVMRIFTSDGHEFPDEELAFLGGVANLAARAVANARLYESFDRMAMEVNSTLDVQQVLHRLLRLLIDQMNVKAASVRLVGPNQKRLHLAAAEGLSETYLKKGDIFIAESPIDRKVLSQNRPVKVFDIQAEQAFQYGQAAQAEGIRSVLAVPLRLHDALIGVLRVYSAQSHRFTDEETALVEALANLGSVALENARLHEALSERFEAAREDWSGWFRFLTLS